VKVELEDGRTVDVVPLSEKIPATWLLKAINSVIGEYAFLNYDRKFTLKQENEWKENTLKGIRKGEQLYFAALHGKRIVGAGSARRMVGSRASGNVEIGIFVVKDFRKVGLGETLMRKTVAEAKKKLKPRNIFLRVAKPNKPARRLYEKVGFGEMARFPKWVKHGGKYHDVVWMVLK